jgi:hypothetical protein
MQQPTAMKQEEFDFDFDLDKEKNRILLCNGSLSLDRLEFETFLDDTGRLDWCNDFYDPSQSDGHGQTSGKYTPEEYWEKVCDKTIQSDLHAYVLHIAKSN